MNGTSIAWLTLVPRLCLAGLRASWIEVSDMLDKNESSQTTIRGLVLPVDWDDKGNVTATAISTHFEEEYLVDQNARGEALLAFLRQRVKVFGSIVENEKGKKIITVSKYEVLEE